MIVQRYSRRYMRRRPGRTLLAVCGIAIGVAAIFGISIALGTTRDAYRQMFSDLAGKAELEIVAAGYGVFDVGLIDQVAGTPGVAAASPVTIASAALTTPGSWTAITVLGVDPARDQALRDYRLSDGRMFDGSDTVVIPAVLAARLDTGVGQTITFLGSGGPLPLRVTGLLKPGGAAAFNGGAVAFTSLPAAQRLNGIDAGVTSIQVVLEPAADKAAVEASLRAALPEGMVVQPPAARAALADASLFSTERGLGVLSFVSLVAGTFVILNSFLMGLSDRARSFALMRALGMTRAQLVRMLIGEAALLGGVGTVLGMALGFGLSVLLNTIVASIVSATLPAVRLTWQPVALCLILGPGVALAATILPAKRCSVRSPLDALDDRRDAGKHDDASPWLHRAGLLCIAFPVLATVALVRTWLPIETLAPMLPPAMAFGLIGAALIVPATFARLSRPLEAALTRLAGVGGRLAIRDLRRHRLRTSLTIAVLAICVVISFGFGNSLISSVEDIRQWVDHIAKYDYFVRRLQPDLGTLSAPSLPESLGADLSALGSVAVADKMSWTTTRVSGLPVVAQISSHTGPGPIPLEVADGDPEALYGRLLAGELAIGSVLAQKFHVRVGDTVTVQTLQGERPFTVAALLSSYTGGGMMMELAWPVGVEAFGIRGVHVWMVTAAPGQREALGDALRSLGATDGFEVESMDDFRAMVDAAMAGVVGASWVIIAFVFVVASLGTVNTLTTHVIEQMRQIALMRAVAMTRRQVRRMIVAAAAAMVVTALVPGVALGFLLAIAMWASHHAVTGYRIDFSVHYSLLIAAVVAALVTAVAAAMFPARRAASMPIIEAIRYE